jgi:hypothetical protein
MSVLSLAKFNQANGTTLIADSVPSNTWAQMAGSSFAEITTSDSFAGTGSLTTGNDGYYNLTLSSTTTFDYTVEGFYKIPSGQTGDITLLEIIYSIGHFRVGVDLSANQLFYVGNGVGKTLITDFSTPSNVLINNWFHVAIQRNKGEFEVQLNGYKSATQTTGGFADTALIELTSVNVGGSANDSGDNGEVLVDEFRVIDEAIYFTNLFVDIDLDPGLVYTVNNSIGLTDLTPELEKVLTNHVLTLPLPIDFSTGNTISVQTQGMLYTDKISETNNSESTENTGTPVSGGQFWG